MSSHERLSQELKAYLDGELSPLRRLAVRLHLARCASCREEVQAMRQIGEDLRAEGIAPLDPTLRARLLTSLKETAAAEPLPSPPPVRRLRQRPLLLAAGGALATLLIGVVYFSRSGSPRFQEAMQSGASAPMASEAMRHTAAATPPAALPTDAAAPPPPVAMKSAVSGRGGAAKSFSTGEISKSSDTAQESSRLAQSSGSFGAQRPKVPQAPPSGEFERGQAVGGSTVTHGTFEPGGNASKPMSFTATVPDAKQAANIARFQTVRSWQAVPRGHRLPVQRAAFDRSGFQITATDGDTIAVPFARQNLAVLQFGRTGGPAYFINEGTAPTLYLPPDGFLENASVPGARWYPLPDRFVSHRPVYVKPAPTWSAFVTMGWYPGMAVYGGMWGDRPQAAFAWTPGFHVQVGSNRIADFPAFLAYNAQHSGFVRMGPIFRDVAGQTGSFGAGSASFGGSFGSSASGGAFGGGRSTPGNAPSAGSKGSARTGR